ncbi:MAG: flagellar hook-basal body complex protein FliE [Lachnospiraceae bacterium]|nr:flagellar hook-basal body complex protein FliE [Lachnospiraceae bacterium]
MMSIDLSSLWRTSGIRDMYTDYSTSSLNGIVNDYKKVSGFDTDNDSAFENVFQSALNLVEQTNEYSNIAEEEELNYAMGLSEDTHTLLIAQSKANTSLMFTVAVRDAVIDAYKEIMNMQF